MGGGIPSPISFFKKREARTTTNNKYGFIYLTTNLINNKKYIGKRRYYKNWKNYLGSGKLLTRAIEKYGKENFSRIILQECDSLEQLDQAEKNWIKHYNAVDSEEFYNIAEGGGGASWKGVKNPRVKKIICLTTNEIFDYIRLASKKYNILANHISANCKNKRHYAGVSEEGKALRWMYYCDYENLTEEEKLKKLNAHIIVDPRIICVTTMEVFEKATDIQSTYNISLGNIISNCSKKLGSAGKHPITNEKMIWMYYKDYIGIT